MNTKLSKQDLADAIINGTHVYINGVRCKGEGIANLTTNEFEVADWGIHEWRVKTN